MPLAVFWTLEAVLSLFITRGFKPTSSMPVVWCDWPLRTAPQSLNLTFSGFRPALGMLLLLESTVGSLHFGGNSYPTWQDLGKPFSYLPSPVPCSDPIVVLFVPRGVAPNSACVLVSL